MVGEWANKTLHGRNLDVAGVHRIIPDVRPSKSTSYWGQPARFASRLIAPGRLKTLFGAIGCENFGPAAAEFCRRQFNLTGGARRESCVLLAASTSGSLAAALRLFLTQLIDCH